ncbi:hypothetical protein VM1G_12052 [Cytospora mali]|uniref:Uncharacterized protein n=1 Tax=Cytospora mali TaxID=578113 RepID=A0A194VIR1_CYTMA|nr:hypothetical protein VM1G_12052 [Valsa mali]
MQFAETMWAAVTPPSDRDELYGRAGTHQDAPEATRSLATPACPCAMANITGVASGQSAGEGPEISPAPVPRPQSDRTSACRWRDGQRHAIGTGASRASASTGHAKADTAPYLFAVYDVNGDNDGKSAGQ